MNLCDLSAVLFSDFIADRRRSLLWQQCVNFGLADSNGKELQDLERLEVERNDRIQLLI